MRSTSSMPFLSGPLFELSEIELFGLLTVCKQMTDV